MYNTIRKQQLKTKQAETLKKTPKKGEGGGGGEEHPSLS